MTFLPSTVLQKGFFAFFVLDHSQDEDSKGGTLPQSSTI